MSRPKEIINNKAGLDICVGEANTTNTSSEFNPFLGKPTYEKNTISAVNHLLLESWLALNQGYSLIWVGEQCPVCTSPGLSDSGILYV